MAHEITANTIIVCDVPTGGYLDLMEVEPETGEIVRVHQFLVQPGRHRANYWLSLLAPGQWVEVSDGCVAFPPRSGRSVTEHPLGMMSDANPAFVVTSAERVAREMRDSLAEMRNLRLAIQKEARKTQADAIVVEEVIPKPAPKPVADPVLEPAPKE